MHFSFRKTLIRQPHITEGSTTEKSKGRSGGPALRKEGGDGEPPGGRGRLMDGMGVGEEPELHLGKRSVLKYFY